MNQKDIVKKDVARKYVAFIRRTHGLDGAVVVQVVTDVFYDAFELLRNSQLYIGEELMQIERIFGQVKDIARIKFAGYTIDTAKKLCSQWIEADYEGFDYDRLIGVPIKYDDSADSKVVAKITAIYNFGAGIICDTTNDMFALDDLDLKDARKGVVYLKV